MSVIVPVFRVVDRMSNLTAKFCACPLPVYVQATPDENDIIQVEATEGRSHHLLGDKRARIQSAVVKLRRGNLTRFQSNEIVGLLLELLESQGDAGKKCVSLSLL